MITLAMLDQYHDDGTVEPVKIPTERLNSVLSHVTVANWIERLVKIAYVAELFERYEANSEAHGYRAAIQFGVLPVAVDDELLLSYMEYARAFATFVQKELDSRLVPNCGYRIAYNLDTYEIDRTVTVQVVPSLQIVRND